MKKKLLILFACTLLVACSKNEQINEEVKDNTKQEVQDIKETTTQKEEKIKFSALGGEISQKIVVDVLNKAGIEENIIDSFIDDVKKYNEYVGNNFDELIDLENIDYYDMIHNAEISSSKEPIGIGNNCRINTFEIMKNNINVNNEADEKTTMLAFDLASLEEQNKFTDDELKNFITYYAAIEAEDSNDFNAQLQKIKETLNNRGIEFKDGKASVVSVYLHSRNELDGNILFVGHTGILVEDEGKLYFIEKLSFEEPYQMVVFNNRAELVKYLQEKYDFPLGENTSKAIILENGKLIEGFK